MVFIFTVSFAALNVKMYEIEHLTFKLKRVKFVCERYSVNLCYSIEGVENSLASIYELHILITIFTLMTNLLFSVFGVNNKDRNTVQCNINHGLPLILRLSKFVPNVA